MCIHLYPPTYRHLLSLSSIWFRALLIYLVGWLSLWFLAFSFVIFLPGLRCSLWLRAEWLVWWRYQLGCPRLAVPLFFGRSVTSDNTLKPALDSFASEHSDRMTVRWCNEIYICYSIMSSDVIGFWSLFLLTSEVGDNPDCSVLRWRHSWWFRPPLVSSDTVSLGNDLCILGFPVPFFVCLLLLDCGGWDGCFRRPCWAMRLAAPSVIPARLNFG